jgi:hypothetical protein
MVDANEGFTGAKLASVSFFMFEGLHNVEMKDSIQEKLFPAPPHPPKQEENSTGTASGVPKQEGTKFTTQDDLSTEEPKFPETEDTSAVKRDPDACEEDCKPADSGKGETDGSV